MTAPQTAAKGTMAECNRCGQHSPLPRECLIQPSNRYTYRAQEMMTLACGHCDCHWIRAADLKEEARR